ncbi:hypothetical protein J2751_002679 [Halorubrum alkaliphilum]|uniref:Uncharacterized protein n=1 Tax=Halorubrum alkaliphilum TaxID=261290 RepID=A0A8T4GGH3_9EURY|nr:hypothetical protein [Halorubrum alkaliphilum]
MFSDKVAFDEVFKGVTDSAVIDGLCVVVGECVVE